MNVGVVLPVYEGEEYVGEAIDSVLAQTYGEFELVVVDDASTDRTVDVVRSRDDPRVTLVENEHNRGVARSRNRGVERVEGDLLAFIDHDDVWHPEKLARHVETHRETGADLVYSDVRFVAADRTPIGPGRRPDPAPPGEPLVRQLLSLEGTVVTTPSSVTLTRSAWDAVGGHDPPPNKSADVELYVRLAGAHRFERIPELLVDKREHDDNMSDDYRAAYEASDRILEDALERYGFLDGRFERRKRARMAYSRATNALVAAEPGEAVRFVRESLGYEPRVRPLLVGALATADLAAGGLFFPGRRLFLAYDDLRGSG